MIPTGDVYEALWKNLAGLVFGGLLGGLGGGLLIWAVGRWLAERSRLLRRSGRTMTAVPEEVGENESAGPPNLEPADGQPG